MPNWEDVPSLETDVTVSLGGMNKKTGKPNPTKIEGYYLGTKEIVSKKSKTGFDYLHVFQTAKGNVGVWGKTHLNRQMKDVAVGVMTQATFVKMKPTPNGDMYEYKVRLDRSNTISVAAPSNSSIEASEPEADAGSYETYAEEDTGAEDESLFAEEAVEDEMPAPMPKKPTKPAATPSAERVARMQAFINKR